MSQQDKYKAGQTGQRPQHIFAPQERITSMEYAVLSSAASSDGAMSVFIKAQCAIAVLEALDPETLSEAEREARENTLEQMYAVAAYISKEYPSSTHLREPEEGATSPME